MCKYLGWLASYIIHDMMEQRILESTQLSIGQENIQLCIATGDGQTKLRTVFAFWQNKMRNSFLLYQLLSSIFILHLIHVASLACI